MKSDKVGRKKYGGSSGGRKYNGSNRPETPQVSSLITSKQMRTSRAISDSYSMMKGGNKSSLKVNPKSSKLSGITSIYDSQLSDDTYDAASAVSTSESVSKNGSSSVFSYSQKMACPLEQGSVSPQPQALKASQSHMSRSSQPKASITPQSQKVPKALKGPLTLQSRVHAGRVREKYQGESEITDMQYLVEEGPLSFRAVAFLGGFFMILASVLDLIDQDKDDLTAMGELITVFLWVFGIIILTLEGRPFNIQIPFLYSFLITFFGCFRFVWGRGFLYFVGGCLQFFLFTKYDMCSGVFFMLLGLTSIVSGYKASVKLAGLRNSISSRSDIKYLFHSFDKDRDGFLNIEEFRDMMMTMDQNVDYNEFVAALSAIDADNNQKISIADMEQWYLEYSEDELPPMMNCCGSARYDLKAQPNNSHNNLQNPNARLLA